MMIEEIILKNTGSTFLLSYLDSGIEKIIPEVSSQVFQHIQGLVTYVHNAKTQAEQDLRALQSEIVQKETERLALVEKNNKLVSFLLETELSAEEMLELIDIYPDWDGESVAYVFDQKVKFEGKLYKVLQAHTSQFDWSPDVAVSLFVEILPPSVIPEWVQPTGAQDAYNIDDQVVFNELVYKSLINANTWSPIAYPQGWQLVN